MVKVRNPLYYGLFSFIKVVNNDENCAHRDFKFFLVCKKILRINDITKLNIEYFLIILILGKRKRIKLLPAAVINHSGLINIE